MLSHLYCFLLPFLLLLYPFLDVPVFPLISRRKFSQIEVLEGLNVLVCISGRKNKLRVYYLSWLRNKIVKGDDVSVGSVIEAYKFPPSLPSSLSPFLPPSLPLSLPPSLPSSLPPSLSPFLPPLPPSLPPTPLQLEGQRTRNGFITVGEMEQCVHYKVGK